MGRETISRTTFVKGLAAGVVVAASLGILTVGEYTIGGGSNPREGGPASGVPENAVSAALSETEAKAEAAEAAALSFTPGTYTASAKGISSDVTVTAVFDEKQITEITADVSGETAGIGTEIADPMIAKALEAQSSEIDGVAGATITSDAFRTALADCIAQASSSSVSENTDAETETASEAVEAETETASEAAEAETETASEAAEPETETTSAVAVIGGADGPTAVFIAGKLSEDDADDIYMEKETPAALDESPEGPFAPGTYTATTAGIDSDIVVTMTFDETSIIDMDIDVSGEAAGIGAMIGDDMLSRIMNAQSADVDGVSGATITSDAVKAAAADCIAQAEAKS